MIAAILQAIGGLGMLVIGAALVVGFAALLIGMAATVRSYWWM